jgi:hypothetical protein
VADRELLPAMTLMEYRRGARSKRIQEVLRLLRLEKFLQEAFLLGRLYLIVDVHENGLT